MISKKENQEKEIRLNMRDGNGEITIQHILKKENFNAKVRLCAKLILSPDASIGLHEHTNEDEVFIILEGKGVVIDDDKEEKVYAGDAVLTGNGSKHSIKNTGDIDLILHAFIAQY